jgi:hypothetical protein
MSTLTSSLVIPDSLLVKDATDTVREHSPDLLFNHSIRVYCSRLSRAVSNNYASTLNASTSPPRFTISVSSRSSRVKTNASRSMAQMPLVNSSPHITSLKSRYKPSGKPLPCTPPVASLSTCAPK